MEVEVGGMEVSDAKRLKQLEDEHRTHSSLGNQMPAKFARLRLLHVLAGLTP